MLAVSVAARACGSPAPAATNAASAAEEMRVRATSAGSVSSACACSFSISARGQKLMPAPYARQRPRRTSGVGDPASRLRFQLGDEPALADTGLAVERDEVWPSLRDRAVERRRQQLWLAPPADERQACPTACPR